MSWFTKLLFGTMKDWWTGNYSSKELKCGMHYALFDYYLYSWPKELCISNKGNLIFT